MSLWYCCYGLKGSNESISEANELDWRNETSTSVISDFSEVLSVQDQINLNILDDGNDEASIKATCGSTKSICNINESQLNNTNGEKCLNTVLIDNYITPTLINSKENENNIDFYNNDTEETNTERNESNPLTNDTTEIKKEVSLFNINGNTISNVDIDFAQFTFENGFIDWNRVIKKMNAFVKFEVYIDKASYDNIDDDVSSNQTMPSTNIKINNFNTEEVLESYFENVKESVGAFDTAPKYVKDFDQILVTENADTLQTENETLKPEPGTSLNYKQKELSYAEVLKEKTQEKYMRVSIQRDSGFVIDGTVSVAVKNWNGLVRCDNTYYVCVFCDVELHKKDLYFHMNAEDHKDNLMDSYFRILAQFGYNLIRRVSEVKRSYHCAICNIEMIESNHRDIDHHCKSSEHIERYTASCSKLQDRMTRLGYVYSNNLAVGTTDQEIPALSTDTEESDLELNINTIRVITGGILIDNTYFLKTTDYHACVRKVNGVYCCLCNVHLTRNGRKTHCKSLDHSQQLAMWPILDKYKNNFIRKIPRNKFFCMFCNIIIVCENNLESHIHDVKHIEYKTRSMAEAKNLLTKFTKI